MTFTLIDTYPNFKAFWDQYRTKSIDQQIDGWRSDYLSPWPGLLTRQIDDYKSDGMDWIEVARERIFPEMEGRISGMELAHANLTAVIEPTKTKAVEALEFSGDLIVVIYVGVGLGAGWATIYEGKPAVLFGLENIVDCGWTGKDALIGLTAHEIGHLVHFQLREEAGISQGSGPWWQLYCEGVAMHCEHLVAGAESWHMRRREGGDDWLDWCRHHRAWLAAEFIGSAHSSDAVRPFFGSWFDIRGYSQTGYFLGLELVKLLGNSLPFREICLLDDADPRIVQGVHAIAESE